MMEEDLDCTMCEYTEASGRFKGVRDCCSLYSKLRLLTFLYLSFGFLFEVPEVRAARLL